MEEKKEIQITILPLNGKEKITKQEFFNTLKTVSHGTNFRAALENIVKAQKGAIIVIENEQVPTIIDGGFKLNCRFTPQKLLELSKMDGAIVLSKDMKKIICANALLVPDHKIPTRETGTRHKAAERTAKMTGTLVIAVSERKREINLYYKGIKHTLIGSNEILRKANEHMQLLEKQRELFDKYLEKLDHLELRNYHNLTHAIHVIQKGRLIQKISADINKHVIELGKEGTLLKTRLKELLADVEEQTDMVIKDYTKLDVKKSKLLLKSLSYDELLDKENIMKILAYESHHEQKPIKGWRVLSKTSFEEQDVAAVVKEAETLGKALHSNVNFYEKILGNEKANKFKEEIERIKLNH